MASAAQRPSPRALIALVQSINPNTTKASRMDDPRRAKEKDEMLEDLVELARRTLASHHSPKQIYDAERVIDRIKRRLSRMPGGRSSVQDFDALLQRLDRLPHPPADLPAVFSLLSHLSFSAPSTSGPIPAPPSRQSIHPSSPVDDPRKRTTSTGSSASLARHDHLAASRRTAVDHVRRNVESRASSVAGSLDGRSATPNIEQRFASIDINRRAAAAETAAKVQEADIGRQRAERNTERIDRERTEEAQGQADPAPVPAQTSPPVGTEPPKIDPKDLGLGTVPKAVVLQRWRDAVKRPLLPERELLRDILYLVQGINGHHVRFEKVAAQASTNDPGVIRTTADDERDAIIKVKIVEDGTGRIPLPVRHLIHRLAEAGKHYQRITSFTRSQATKEQTGRIMQSLCHFLDREIEEFYELICYLEALFDAGPAPAETPLTATTPVRSVIPLPPADRNRGLTLKRVLVLVEPSLLRMRLMSSLVEGAQHTHGGALVSLIHNYTFNGDPLVRELTEKLLEEVSKSFFDSLSRWIFEGELYDPFREFFIELNPEAHAATGQQGVVGLAYTSPLGEVDAASLWENKFTLRTELVPAFLSEGFARKIFSSGKSLNFIRHSCGVSDWQEARGAILQTTANSFARPSVDANSLPALQYRDLTGLERTIDTVHSTVSKRLLDIFLDKLKLREHLRAINDYLLLTRGDFADVLMESLSPILHKQASTLYRHSLSGALETAIRGSNAQFDDADILRRLDARVLEFSGNETGWDTFTLEYRVDSPVNTVLDASAMAEYQQVFQHLWRMKRVEGSLSNSCVNLMGASNALSKATFDGVRGKERRSVEKDEDIEGEFLMDGRCWTAS